MAGIYIHIPFCKQACSYCDFYFITRQKLRTPFVERLVSEIRSYQNTRFTSEPVGTIYIGGGTPSLLSLQQLGSVIEAVDDTFDLHPGEVTLEMNPDDVTAEYLAGLKELGITRASMGVQTFQPELLTFMNRAHSSEEARQCLHLLRNSGFEAFTVDLIYGNPGQTLQQLNEDIEQLLEFNPPHISAYSLTVESNTRLGKQVELGRIDPPEEDAVADYFELINEVLAENGIYRYEVSNYSIPGREASHNSNYWRHQNYLGFGPGAHSFWWEDEARRWSNKPDIKAFLHEDDSREEAEVLSMQQLAEERLMMGLRTTEGISQSELEDRYDYHLSERQKDYLNTRDRKGLLEFDERIRLTDDGILIADAITLDLITLDS